MKVIIFRRRWLIVVSIFSTLAAFFILRPAYGQSNPPDCPCGAEYRYPDPDNCNNIAGPDCKNQIEGCEPVFNGCTPNCPTMPEPTIPEPTEPHPTVPSGQGNILTPTLQPTRTPTLQPTRVPTSQPQPTSAPAPPCVDVMYSGQPAPGSTVTLSALAEFDDPSNTYRVVRFMFHVNLFDAEIARSPEITVTRINQGLNPTNGKRRDVYEPSWNYTFPTSGSGQTIYTVYVQVLESTYQPLGVLGQTAQANQNPQKGFLERVLSLFGINSARLFSQPTALTPSPTASFSVQSTSPRPGNPEECDSRSLQLCVLPRVKVETGCQWVRFWIYY